MEISSNVSFILVYYHVSSGIPIGPSPSLLKMGGGTGLDSGR